MNARSNILAFLEKLTLAVIRLFAAVSSTNTDSCNANVIEKIKFVDKIL